MDTKEGFLKKNLKHTCIIAFDLFLLSEVHPLEISIVRSVDSKLSLLLLLFKNTFVSTEFLNDNQNNLFFSNYLDNNTLLSSGFQCYY